MSGLVSVALVIASLPSAASATTSQFGCEARILRRPERTTSWSSAIKMRIDLACCCPCISCFPLQVQQIDALCRHPRKPRNPSEVNALGLTPGKRKTPRAGPAPDRIGWRVLYFPGKAPPPLAQQLGARL